MPSKKCEHGKRPSVCKLCGGISICEHNRYKAHCKECKGSQICEHNRIRSSCKPCKGTSICLHNRMRVRCKECKGTCICEHNLVRSACSRCKPDVVYKHIRWQANRREIDFEITLDEFKKLVSGSCVSCGECEKPIGIDRINSQFGYRPGNVQPFCKICNTMKLDYTEQEFDTHIIKIIQHRPELAGRAGFKRISE